MLCRQQRGGGRGACAKVPPLTKANAKAKPKRDSCNSLACHSTQYTVHSTHVQSSPIVIVNRWTRLIHSFVHSRSFVVDCTALCFNHGQPPTCDSIKGCASCSKAESHDDWRASPATGNVDSTGTFGDLEGLDYYEKVEEDRYR